jgi:hypothetical protein
MQRNRTTTARFGSWPATGCPGGFPERHPSAMRPTLPPGKYRQANRARWRPRKGPKRSSGFSRRSASRAPLKTFAHEGRDNGRIKQPFAGHVASRHDLAGEASVGARVVVRSIHHMLTPVAPRRQCWSKYKHDVRDRGTCENVRCQGGRRCLAAPFFPQCPRPQP